MMRWFWVILIFAVLVIGGGVAYYFYYVPAHSVSHVVEVTHDPWVSLLLGKQTVLMDESGQFLIGDTYEGLDSSSTIIVMGLGRDLLGKAFLSDIYLQALSEIIRPLKQAFPAYAWRVEVGDLRRLGDDFYFVDVTLLQNDSLPIKIGEGRNVAHKIELLKQLVEMNPQVLSHSQYIDARVEDKLYVKQK